MQDFLGQEIKVGSKVLHSGGKTERAGFGEGPYEVIAIGPKKITVKTNLSWREKTSWWPDTVVVVDRLLRDS